MTKTLCTTSFKVDFDKEQFRSVTLRDCWSLNGEKVLVWPINFNETLDKPEFWQKALAPISEAARKLKKEAGPEI